MGIVLGTSVDFPLDGVHPVGLAWYGTYLWYSDALNQQIVAVDPASGERGSVFDCPGAVGDLTSQDGLLYQVAERDRRIRLVDPDTGRELGAMSNPRPGYRLTGIEATAGGMWIGYADLQRIELYATPRMTLIRSIELADGISGITVSDQSLIYSSRSRSSITVLDLTKTAPGTRPGELPLDVPGRPTGLTWDGSQVWYCDEQTVQLRAVAIPGVTVI